MYKPPYHPFFIISHQHHNIVIGSITTTTMEPLNDYFLKCKENNIKFEEGSQEGFKQIVDYVP